ncbi:MAG: cob(I)yrinic acid a,c-diamide adenosyltransferase [Maricaulis sp.]|uniref:cob(I)yrinic acid a,c-diamide adenosyltransferase n=1 Tax=Maricaulis sp. TaxID=1486257 RepID=UPI001B003FC2|nr:cob(I)yrinic acid a,c-diamide adenosyltransferase [Maricaulis sp.]MBO6730357.1 cob(I)yrinic acid a,c-diamide adenosyltransferase [Maricaulis sp.]MBO6848599.1 cob(I)yrinic acid a,c-diamide adenosyltransferase [Maricaulis sp.]MBO6878543.1 cob(I)yrinic acid a,c-diamide adenosyltransferase [Maricaulis sp.]
MVRLTKIYTRSGDAGRTRLGDMSETDKHDLRVDAYGDVDEANSAIGLARSALGTAHTLDRVLSTIQNDLFDLGADLCVPESDQPREWEPLRVKPDQVDALEAHIDHLNADLEPLNSFILPAGTEASARLHLARTVCRRAERKVSALLASGARVNGDVLRYLNRLSDLLFVMARTANDNGKADVLWVPGGQRG